MASKSLEVHSLMEKAGASKEEIEEMMAMMMSKGGGISKDFLANISHAMESGGNHQATCSFRLCSLHTPHNVVVILQFTG